MNLCCVWGDTRTDVEVAYALLEDVEHKPQRVTWRLTAAFDPDNLVGDECFAPFNAEIREAYGELIPQVDEPAVDSAAETDEE